LRSPVLSVPFSAESPACRGIRHLSWRIHYDCILFALRAWPPDFGDGGLVSRDSTYPVWRAGADAATTLRTGAISTSPASMSRPAPIRFTSWCRTLKTGSSSSITRPARTKILTIRAWIWAASTWKWRNRQVPVENLKYTITTKGDTGKLQLEWENHIASVSFRAN